MTIPDFLSLTRGTAPLLLSVPHAGTMLPDDLAGRFVSPALARKDADWHVDRLYAGVVCLGVTVLKTAVSRSVIDVNRDPSGRSLYPGQTTTGLCPIETFDGEPLYRAGCEPDDAEIERRCETYFGPYHQVLAREIDRLRKIHPRVVVIDAHSIRSVVPRLFDGLLPNVNIGTNDGKSCSPEVAALLERICADHDQSAVTNGRFKGGWITRHYGKPALGVHLIQIELAMRGYLADPLAPLSGSWAPDWDGELAKPLAKMLRDYVKALGGWAALEQAS